MCAYFVGSIRGLTTSNSWGPAGTAFSPDIGAVRVAKPEYNDCSAVDTTPAEGTERADSYAEFGWYSPVGDDGSNERLE
jgi:hypothetical protein